MSSINLIRGDAILALSLLKVQGVITGYMTNFKRADEPGVQAMVVVTIAARDELALERVKRQVRKALEPFFPDVQVTVSWDQIVERRP